MYIPLSVTTTLQKIRKLYGKLVQFNKKEITQATETQKTKLSNQNYHQHNCDYIKCKLN